jgi:hypothetical protein
LAANEAAANETYNNANLALEFFQIIRLLKNECEIKEH